MKTKDDEKGIHDGHRERMRFRFERDLEMEAFNEHEMLEYLLYYAIPRKDTNLLAHKLIKIFGSYANVFNATVADLTQVKEMTHNAALLIRSIKPISRSINISRARGRDYIYTSDDAIKFLSGYFIGETSEKAYIACMDINGRILDVINVGRGTGSSTTVDLPKVIQAVSVTNASKVLLMHNHPAENLHPSNSDIITTNYAILMLYSHKTKLVDHLIFSPAGEYFSFFQNQFIEKLLRCCSRALAVDVSKLYRLDEKMHNYENSVILNESAKTEYNSLIGELFEHSDDMVQRLFRGDDDADDYRILDD